MLSVIYNRSFGSEKWGSGGVTADFFSNPEALWCILLVIYCFLLEKKDPRCHFGTFVRIYTFWCILSFIYHRFLTGIRRCHFGKFVRTLHAYWCVLMAVLHRFLMNL